MFIFLPIPSPFEIDPLNPGTKNSHNTNGKKKNEIPPHAESPRASTIPAPINFIIPTDFLPSNILSTPLMKK